MAGTVEGVIRGPAGLKAGLAALLRLYRPAEGQSWLSAKLTVELTTHEESFTVVNLPPPSSPEEPGRPVTNQAWDSAHQNHEGCPGGQSMNSSSPESLSQIENIETIVEAVGGSMPLGQASGSDATLSTAFEIEVKSEERVEDWSVVHVTSAHNTGPMTDERAEGESLTLDDFTDMPVLSMEPQIDVQGQSLQATEDEGTGGEGMETDDSNYEPDSSDENGRDSEGEPEMMNVTISNVRTLPESAVETPNLPGVAHLDKTEAKNQSKNPCNICGKGFFSKYTLRRHISHIHDRPKRKRPTQFKCRECGSAYKRKGALNEHMRVHRADCPFRCNLCQKPWPSKHQLERHVRSHTGERPFQCPICEKEWARKDDLANHVRKTHPK